MSGATSAEHTTAHFKLRMTSGPSIAFSRSDDEQRHHAEGREKLKVKLERAGTMLEAALGGLDAKARALVEPYREAPRLAWSSLQSDAERALDQHGYSPYASQLLEQARKRVAGAPFDRTWDAILAKSFVLELQHQLGGETLETEVRIAARPARADLERLVGGFVKAMRPARTLLRIQRSGARHPSSGVVDEDDQGTFVARGNHVIVRLVRPGPSAATARDLARRVARRIEGELAPLTDLDGDFDPTFAFALRKGGYRVATEPSGGMSTVSLAEVPAEIELTVRLRTVETDHGGTLDRLLVERMFELCKGDVAGLKRHDSPNATSEIGPTDWVIARL